MKECWFVVEAYCLLSLIRAIGSAMRYANEPAFLFAAIVNVVFVFILAFYVFRGWRIASRLLSVHILLSTIAFFALEVLQGEAIDIYSIYGYTLYVYLLIGAIKLWRIKELPTRFTDPPAQA